MVHLTLPRVHFAMCRGWFSWLIDEKQQLGKTTLLNFLAGKFWCVYQQNNSNNNNGYKFIYLKRELFELSVRYCGCGIINPSKRSDLDYQNSANLTEQNSWENIADLHRSINMNPSRVKNQTRSKGLIIS